MWVAVAVSSSSANETKGMTLVGSGSNNAATNTASRRLMAANSSCGHLARRMMFHTSAALHMS